jgi:hypothetical protein
MAAVRILVLGLFLVFAGCETEDGWLATSLTQLIANPNEYEDRSIEVVGYADRIDASHWLFLSPGHASARDVLSAVRIYVTADAGALSEIELCEGAFVRVWGKFVLPEDGFSGLTEIQRVMRYEADGSDASDCFLARTVPE